MKKYSLFLYLVAIVFLVSFSVRAISPSNYGLKEGDLISAIFSDDPDVYIINEHGYKRLFLNPEIFKFYSHLGGFANIKLVTPEIRDSFPTSGFFRNCEDNDQKVYGTSVEGEDSGRLHWINKSGDQAVQEDPEFFKKVFCINRKEFGWYPKGTEFRELKEVPQYRRTVEVENPVICHHPTDDPTTFQTIRVAPESLDAHFQHGDTKGACSTSSVQQTFPVDVKINGSDNPASVPYDSVFTVSWTSKDAVSCRDFGQFIPAVDGGTWAKFINLLTSGTKSLYARTGEGYLATLDIQVQCVNTAGQFSDDVIHLSVQPPTTSVPTVSVIPIPTITPTPTITMGSTPTAASSSFSSTPTPVSTSSPQATPTSTPIPTPTLPSTSVPSAPTTLSRGYIEIPPSGYTANLSWVDTSTNESNFKIYRRFSDGSWIEIASVGAGITVYSDTKNPAATGIYDYYVKACNSLGCSASSNFASVTISSSAPVAPSGLSAVYSNNNNNHSVSLSWTDNSSNEWGFRLKRRIQGQSSWFGLATTTPPSFTDTYQLDYNTTYQYIVRAYNSFESVDSNMVSVTTAYVSTPTPTPTVACVLNVSVSSSTPSDQSVNQGQSGVSLVKFDLVPNCSGMLKSFAVSLLPMPSGYQNVSSLRLYNDSTGAQLGSTMTVTGASVNFADVNTNLSANQILTLKVVGDINPSATVGSSVYGVFGGSWAVDTSNGNIGNNASGNIIAGRTMTIISASTPTPSSVDTISPSTPASLTSTMGSSSQVNLSWPASTDNVAVTSYSIKRTENWTGGSTTLYSKSATPYSSTYSFSDSGVLPGQQYSYGVAAQDAAGNLSLYWWKTVNVPAVSPTPTPTPSAPATTSFDIFSRDLAFGSRGDDVKQLQALLVNEVNYPINLITGYFGNITREAVKKLQEKYGVKPVSGYFGQITRGVLKTFSSN